MVSWLTVCQGGRWRVRRRWDWPTIIIGRCRLSAVTSLQRVGVRMLWAQWSVPSCHQSVAKSLVVWCSRSHSQLGRFKVPMGVPRQSHRGVGGMSRFQSTPERTTCVEGRVPSSGSETLLLPVWSGPRAGAWLWCSSYCQPTESSGQSVQVIQPSPS